MCRPQAKRSRHTVSADYFQKTIIVNGTRSVRTTLRTYFKLPLMEIGACPLPLLLLRSRTLKKHKVFLLSLLLLLASTVGHAKIVFDSERNGIDGVYVMDDDGSNQTLLTDEFRAHSPSWSPDGRQIVFNRYVHGSVVLCLMHPDGTNIRQLTEKDKSYINRASFSPDGKSLVFNRLTFNLNDGQKSRTIVLNIETGKMKEISDFWGLQHDWAPDGKHIICAEPFTDGVNNTIWIMEADGHNLRPLIPAVVGGEFTIRREFPRWSPDGQQIVFLQVEWKRAAGGEFFYKAFRYMTCNRNGANLRSLHIPKDMEGNNVDWMDDGESIVFSAYADIPLNQPLQNFEYPPPNIYKYHIWTRDMTRLTNHPGRDVTIDWISDDVLPVSPQGKKKVTWGTVKQQGSE